MVRSYDSSSAPPLPGLTADEGSGEGAASNGARGSSSGGSKGSALEKHGGRNWSGEVGSGGCWRAVKCRMSFNHRSMLQLLGNTAESSSFVPSQLQPHLQSKPHHLESLPTITFVGTQRSGVQSVCKLCMCHSGVLFHVRVSSIRDHVHSAA